IAVRALAVTRTAHHQDSAGSRAVAGEADVRIAGHGVAEDLPRIRHGAVRYLDPVLGDEAHMPEAVDPVVAQARELDAPAGGDDAALLIGEDQVVGHLAGDVEVEE